MYCGGGELKLQLWRKLDAAYRKHILQAWDESRANILERRDPILVPHRGNKRQPMAP